MTRTAINRPRPALEKPLPPDTELLSWLALQCHAKLDMQPAGGSFCTIHRVEVGNIVCIAPTLREALARAKELSEQRAFAEGRRV